MASSLPSSVWNAWGWPEENHLRPSRSCNLRGGTPGRRSLFAVEFHFESLTDFLRHEGREVLKGKIAFFADALGVFNGNHAQKVGRIEMRVKNYFGVGRKNLTGGCSSVS